MTKLRSAQVGVGLATPVDVGVALTVGVGVASTVGPAVGPAAGPAVSAATEGRQVGHRLQPGLWIASAVAVQAPGAGVTVAMTVGGLGAGADGSPGPQSLVGLVQTMRRQLMCCTIRVAVAVGVAQGVPPMSTVCAPGTLCAGVGVEFDSVIGSSVPLLGSCREIWEGIGWFVVGVTYFWKTAPVARTGKTKRILNDLLRCRG